MALAWHLYLMASLYILAGLNHFRVPRLYVRMIPPTLPAPKLLNIISGAAEVILGILLCFPQLSHIAAWGLILLLVAVFPANIYMYTNDKAGMGLPKWLLLLRLPLQLALIYWAWLYT
ncbi:DoxX family protein [Flavobacterium album]|uniref:DoxX family protein n=1 Tax=Flavobacterium album TaxID=2175091 RepID=A0A2S1QTT1_9FLAO|nr:DoxX family membrane protein [Flavobacterium album]AWH83729.1 DoxX family protein [Flavobacterium album]